MAIPDLRVVALETNLHRDGTVRNDPAALAIRIETLLITAHDGAIRPPREIPVALATWLRSLAPAEPPAQSTAAQTRGAALFAATCASCHVPPAFSGPPVPLDVVGTIRASASPPIVELAATESRRSAKSPRAVGCCMTPRCPTSRHFSIRAEWVGTASAST